MNGLRVRLLSVDGRTSGLLRYYYHTLPHLACLFF